MKYKFELSIKTILFCCLLTAGIATADSVTKTLYVDGSEVGTATASNGLSFPFPRLTIGSEGNRYYRYNGLIGQIDEFAVYNGVLTDANVSAHFSAGTGGYVAAVQADNPVLYLRFEDGTSNEGDKAANTESADINSTYIGDINLVTGYVGNAAELYGSDCIDVCDWDLQLSLTDISVEFWVKTTQSSDYPRLFQHNGDTAEEGSYGAMYVAETNDVGLIGGDETTYLGAVLNDGSWHHVVVTFETLQVAAYEVEVMADDPCLYIKFDNLTAPDSSENHYYVWYQQPYEPNSEQHAGKIRPAAGAIGGGALYCDNSTPNAGQETRVIAWNNYGGTNWREFPGWSDLYGEEYAFAPSDITFELWMKSTPELTSTQYANVFQQIGGWQREPNAPFLGLTDGNNPDIAGLRVGGGSTFWYPGVTGILDGEWHQIVVTYDENEVDLGGSLGIQIYVDGSLANETTIYDPNNHRAKLGNPFGANPGGEFYTLVIGAANNVGYAYNTYGGWIDEFAVYAGVLSGDRIAAHYAAWQPRSCADVAARGLHYKGDMDGDCDVDFYDYALFAQGWAGCNDPGGCP